MDVRTHRLSLRTKGHTDMHDITSAVAGKLAETGLRDGTVTLFVPGATAGLSTVEYEPGLIKDIPEMFERIAPYDRDYHHHQTWGDYNGGAHCRATLIGPSMVVPFTDGKLTLGTWQQIVLIDFDDRGRNREVVCQFLGV